MLMTLMIHPNVLRSSAIGEHEEKPFMVLSVLTSVLSNDLPQSADNVPAAPDPSLSLPSPTHPHPPCTYPTCLHGMRPLTATQCVREALTPTGALLDATGGGEAVAHDARPLLWRPARACDQVLP